MASQIINSTAYSELGDEATVRLSRWSSHTDEDRFPIFNPATGRVIALVQGCGLAEVDTAVRASRMAFERDWRHRLVSERSHLLSEAARVIRQHGEELAQLIAAQNGTLIGEALNIDVDQCAKAFRYFGSAAVVLPNGFTDGGSYHDHVLAEPYGVIGVLTPTASPLLYVGAKLAPALVAGNTVVLKPSCGSTLAVTRLIELIAPIFPSGVLQLVLGPGATVGRALVDHPLVSKISFTGNTEVGKDILRRAADKVMPAIVQLGSQNAVIVCDDANPMLALRAIIEGVYANHGETRTALRRVFLQRRIHDRILAQLALAVSRFKVGDGLRADTQLGPMSSLDRQQSALQQIAAARAAGARLVAQADLSKDEALQEGYFVPPTVLADVRQNMSIMQEAFSGPIACVAAFNSVDEAIAMANDSQYGLLAVVFTGNNEAAARFGSRLEVSMVYLNNFQRIGHATVAPSGGSKASGCGREDCSLDTLREYTQQRIVRTPTQIASEHYWSVVDDVLSG
ncbi:MAG: aldehyde dehydrogenase family protein [Steroidobacteraceae bacterium]